MLQWLIIYSIKCISQNSFSQMYVNSIMFCHMFYEQFSWNHKSLLRFFELLALVNISTIVFGQLQLERQNLRYNYGHLIFESSSTQTYYGLCFFLKRQIIHVYFTLVKGCIIELAKLKVVREKVEVYAKVRLNINYRMHSSLYCTERAFREGLACCISSWIVLQTGE